MPTSSSGIRTPTFVVDPSRLQQRHKLTPYAGTLARAAACATTFVRGERVWDDEPARRAPYGGRLL